MNLTQTCTIPVSREKLWDFLMDVPAVSRCLPGVEAVEPLGGGTYQGTVKVQVGPIRLTLQGKITIEEQDRSVWWALLKAEATDRKLGGGIRARVGMTLTPRELSDGTATHLTVETDLTMLGKIGEFGQPIIKKKADALMSEFAANVQKALA